MANIRTCNKHNMIACVEKTAQNADFYQIIDYLTGCSINYSLLVDPDLIGPWLQQFWTTASLRVINDVPHIRAMVAGKKILISEETIRADLLFDDANGVDCFPKQVIWDTLRDIGYEGNLAQLTFSKPLFSPQWKYLIHVLLHCLSPKSTSWEQFGTNIASALVGLATNQNFNFSLMIMNGMLGHISNGTPFLMYPRITPLTPSMLEVVTALAAEEEHSTSPHSKAASSARDAQGTPSQSAAQASISQGTDDVQGTASLQGTDASLGTARLQGTAAIPTSPNDYTPTDASQTSGGDEGLLDIYALNREPVVKHHAFWVESQNLKKQKRRRKKQRKKVSSVKMGRNKEEGTLSEEHYDQEEDTADPFFDDIVDKDAAIAPDIDRKSNETEVLEEKVILRLRLLYSKDSKFLKMMQSSNPPPSNSSMELMNNLKLLDVLCCYVLDQESLGNYKMNEEVAKKIQAIWDAEEEGKRFEELKKAKPKTTLRVKPTSLAQERNKMMNFLKGQGYKNLQKLKYPQMKCCLDKVRDSIKDSYKDFIPMGYPSKKGYFELMKIRSYLRVVDFEKCAQERESLEGLSMITELQVIDSPDGEYLIIHRGNNHFRAFDTLWEILHILDRQDLYHLYRVVQDYYEHIPPTGLGLILLGDLTTIWETPETSGDDFWKNQEDWEIVRWRLNESSGVHTLELEDGTMIHMLAERRYPLSRELMIRMLEHGMEVEDENETAMTYDTSVHFVDN
ncbi:hypothetical protein Tco_0368832 [Tanacetum coccineum]